MKERYERGGLKQVRCATHLVQADDIRVLEQLERPDLPPDLQTAPAQSEMDEEAAVSMLGGPDWNLKRLARGGETTCVACPTWSSMRRERILLRSRILMAKWPPVAMWRAYFTLPKLPSPRVRPISYLPSSDARVHSASARCSPFTIHKRAAERARSCDRTRPRLAPSIPLSVCLSVCLSLCLPRSSGMDEAAREGGGRRGWKGAGYL
jgi:hypothetical protein